MKIDDEPKMIQLLKTSEVITKIEILDQLVEKELSNEMCSCIADLIQDDDKGLRNAATSFIKNNRNPKFPGLIAHFITSSDLSIRNLAGEILIDLGYSIGRTAYRF